MVIHLRKRCPSPGRARCFLSFATIWLLARGAAGIARVPRKTARCAVFMRQVSQNSLECTGLARANSERSLSSGQTGVRVPRKTAECTTSAQPAPRKTMECTGRAHELGTPLGFSRRAVGQRGTPGRFSRPRIPACGTPAGFSRCVNRGAGTPAGISRRAGHGAGTPGGFSRRAGHTDRRPQSATKARRLRP